MNNFSIILFNINFLNFVFNRCSCFDNQTLMSVVMSVPGSKISRPCKPSSLISMMKFK